MNIQDAKRIETAYELLSAVDAKSFPMPIYVEWERAKNSLNYCRLNLHHDEDAIDFQICHRYLYHASLDMIQNQAVYRSIFIMGDGYGQMDAAELTINELWYDWSHIRDSSEVAIFNMAKAIRAWLK